MTTGDKILNLRKDKNITQEQLADMLGVSRQSVSKWESNTAYPEIDKLIRMSEIFNVSTDYLLKDNQEKNQDTISKNRINNYNNATLIIAIILIFGYVAGLLLSYQIKKMEIGFFVFIPFIFGALISYIIVRSKFYVKSLYSNEDQKTMFRNTKIIYYTCIFTFITILPRFFITIPIELDLPYYDRITIAGSLSLSGFLIFASLYSLIAFVISWVVGMAHKNYVYKINNNISLGYIIVNAIISIIIIGYASNLLANNHLSHNYLIPLALLITLIYLIVFPIIYVIQKKLTYKIFIIYLLLTILICIGLESEWSFYPSILVGLFLLIFSIIEFRKANKAKNIDLIFLYKNIIIAFVAIILSAIPFLIFYLGGLYSIIILVITAISLFGFDIRIEKVKLTAN